MKKTLILLAFFSFFLLPSPTYADFPDVSKDSEYFEAITELTNLGVIEGYPDGHFYPDQIVNRAEFLKMAYLSRTLSDSNFSKADLDALKDQVKNLNCFSDVTENLWFAPMVCLAKEEEVISGYPDGTFKGDQSVNVAEVAKILVGSRGIFDVEDLSQEHWALSYFQLFSTKTLPASITAPDQWVTRAEAAEMIWRFLLGDQIEVAKKTSNLMVWNKETSSFLTLEYIGTVAGNHYAKNDEAVYVVNGHEWYVKKLQNADPSTFTVSENEVTFSYKGKPVTWKLNIPLDANSLYGSTGDYVGGSRGQSFAFFTPTPIQLEGGSKYFYGHDAYHIFALYCSINHCSFARKFDSSRPENFETFKDFGFGVSRTNDFVYVDGVIQPEIDLSSFEYLGDGYYKDKSGAYLGGELISKDIESFQHIVFETTYACPSPFSKDSQFVYIHGKPVSELNPISFKIIQEYGLFYGDVNHVYKLILDAKGSPCSASFPFLITTDPDNFKPLGAGYAEMDHMIYYIGFGNMVLTTADPETFESYAVDAVNQFNPDIEFQISSFGRDNQFVYYSGKAIEAFDVETFDYELPWVTLGDSVGILWRDKNGKYTWNDLYKITGQA